MKTVRVLVCEFTEGACLWCEIKGEKVYAELFVSSLRSLIKVDLEFDLLFCTPFSSCHVIINK